MGIKLFVKNDCPRCPAAKHMVEGLTDVEVYDVDDMDGLAEASFYNIMSTPTILVVDAKGNELVGWRGEVPDAAHFRSAIAN